LNHTARLYDYQTPHIYVKKTAKNKFKNATNYLPW